VLAEDNGQASDCVPRSIHRQHRNARLSVPKPARSCNQRIGARHHLEAANPYAMARSA
jgi:hypothetical protein